MYIPSYVVLVCLFLCVFFSQWLSYAWKLKSSNAECFCKPSLGSDVILTFEKMETNRSSCNLYRLTWAGRRAGFIILNAAMNVAKAGEGEISVTRFSALGLVISV